MRAGQSFTEYEWSKYYRLPQLIRKHVNKFLGVLLHTVLTSILHMIRALPVRLLASFSVHIYILLPPPSFHQTSCTVQCCKTNCLAAAP
jgi:hypothetical protein